MLLLQRKVKARKFCVHSFHCLPAYIHHQIFDGPLTRKDSHSTEKSLLSFHKQTSKLNPVFPFFFWPGKSPFPIPSVFVPYLRIMQWTRVGFKNKNFPDMDQLQMSHSPIYTRYLMPWFFFQKISSCSLGNWMIFVIYYQLKLVNTAH